MLYSIWVVFKKEFCSFFNSASGYIVIALFLLGTSLFLWVFPNDYNVLNSGYASLDGLFALAPWLYLFLCPAITMRLFAEERQQGTIELLITRPISKLSLVLGKMFAGWMLVLVALAPTLIWYFSINILAEPAGNVDSGAFWGSFIGLVLLAALYTSIGVFASALSMNQIVSFMLAVLFSFILFYGFELLGSLFTNGDIEQAIQNFGINAHYKSMSRGVIDSRDLLYFTIIITLFAWGTKTVLLAQKLKK